MPNILQKLGRCLALLALVQLLGGHWAALQTVAWSKMFYRYAREDTLRAAVVKTFDGAHPCELCKSIGKSRQQEQKEQEGEARLVKMEAVLVSQFDLPSPNSSLAVFSIRALHSEKRTYSPLIPPPRRA